MHQAGRRQHQKEDPQRRQRPDRAEPKDPSSATKGLAGAEDHKFSTSATLGLQSVLNKRYYSWGPIHDRVRPPPQAHPKSQNFQSVRPQASNEGTFDSPTSWPTQLGYRPAGPTSLSQRYRPECTTYT
eukprot:COSAG01_NODE_3048_length_6669_cov_138.195282_8_plen_128_part_00